MGTEGFQLQNGGWSSDLTPHCMKSVLPSYWVSQEAISPAAPVILGGEERPDLGPALAGLGGGFLDDCSSLLGG